MAVLANFSRQLPDSFKYWLAVSMLFAKYRDKQLKISKIVIHQDGCPQCKCFDRSLYSIGHHRPSLCEKNHVFHSLLPRVAECLLKLQEDAQQSLSMCCCIDDVWLRWTPRYSTVPSDSFKPVWRYHYCIQVFKTASSLSGCIVDSPSRQLQACLNVSLLRKSFWERPIRQLQACLDVL